VSRGVKDAAVVIIGGGVMGTSTAYQLARAGVQNAVLLEANELASGSSGSPSAACGPCGVPEVGRGRYLRRSKI